MTTSATIPQADLILVQDPVGKELRPKRSDLRQRIARLLSEIFEGHEELLGMTPD